MDSAILDRVYRAALRYYVSHRHSIRAWDMARAMHMAPQEVEEAAAQLRAAGLLGDARLERTQGHQVLFLPAIQGVAWVAGQQRVVTPC